MKNVALALGILAALPSVGEATELKTFKHRVAGLFSHDREADLREAVKKMTGVDVVSIDFDMAEVTFSYDPGKLFEKGTKEKDWLERFDNLLRQSSSHTFSAKPLFPTPKEKLVRVEIGVVLPDCRGCCLGVYEILAKADGVAQATADLKEGRVTALIDPEKTNRAALQDALKKREVKLKGS
jgi:copper chaperone CopZ